MASFMTWAVRCTVKLFTALKNLCKERDKNVDFIPRHVQSLRCQLDIQVEISSSNWTTGSKP